METPSTKALNAQYKFALVPYELIDPPELPERETMDPQELAELSMNIREVGLIKPIVLKPVGKRYEIIAGHRRFMACGLGGYTPIPSMVMVHGQVDPLAIMVSENAHTENVNPVEEARFYQRLLDERCGNDVDALCVAVKKRREYVEDRLLILRGDPRVTDALHQKKISFAVARELNRIRDDNRRLLYLDVAINQGASARQVMEWRKSSELLAPLVVSVEGTPAEGEQSYEPSPVSPMQCMFCCDTDDPHLMQYVAIHAACLKALLRMLRGQAVPADHQAA